MAVWNSLSGSLADPGLGSLLDKAPTISLKDLSSATGGGTSIFTRTNAGSGYNRINIYSHDDGKSSDGSAPHGMQEFNGYNHSLVDRGTVDTTYAYYGEIGFAWDLPTGFDTAKGCDQQLFWDSTGYNSQTDCINNATTNTSLNSSLGATTSYTASGLTAGKWYGFRLKGSWNDSVDTYDSDVYFLSGVNALLTDPYGFAVGPVFDDTPTITGVTSGSRPLCSNNVTHTVSFSAEGPSKLTLLYCIDGTPSCTYPSGWTTASINLGPGGGSHNVTVTADGGTIWYRLLYNDLGTSNYDEFSEVLYCTL